MPGVAAPIGAFVHVRAGRIEVCAGRPERRHLAFGIADRIAGSELVDVDPVLPLRQAGAARPPASVRSASLRSGRR